MLQGHQGFTFDWRRENPAARGGSHFSAVASLSEGGSGRDGTGEVGAWTAWFHAFLCGSRIAAEFAESRSPGRGLAAHLPQSRVDARCHPSPRHRRALNSIPALRCLRARRSIPAGVLPNMKLLKTSILIAIAGIFGAASNLSAADSSVPKDYPLKKCPVSDEKLGEHGKPVKVTYQGTDVYLCCKSCVKDFNKEPEKFTMVFKDANNKHHRMVPPPDQPGGAAFFELRPRLPLGITELSLTRTMRFTLLLCAVVVLTGCASAPSPIAVIDHDHPASPMAGDGTRPPRVSLRNDPATHRTHELIEQRKGQLEQPVVEGTSSGGQIAKPAAETSTPGTKGHERH